MAQIANDRSLGNGVYFAARDYVGVISRIVILGVDTLVLFIAYVAMAMAWTLTGGELDALFTVLYLAFCWLYSVPLRRSAVGTLGYLVTGSKLVTLQGGRPSLFMLTLRSLLWLLPPFSYLFDLIWSGIDSDRQGMRDRYSGMCLVKKRAQPIGSGEIHMAVFSAGSYFLVYPRVVHPTEAIVL